MPVRSRGSHRSAFSLVELLVVVSVIALLIALLLPGIDSARYSARLAVCASNLRSIMIANNSYAGDYVNWYPHGNEVLANDGSPVAFTANYQGDTKPYLIPYLGSGTPSTNRVWQCPQGVRNHPGGLKPNYYANFANVVDSIENGAKRDTTLSSSHPNYNKFAAIVRSDLLQKPGDTMATNFFRNSDFPDGVRGRLYSIVASDITMVANLGLQTNHVKGAAFVVDSSSDLGVATNQGIGTTNYAFTDGSVRPYSYNTTNSQTQKTMQMSVNRYGVFDSKRFWFPKAWGTGGYPPP